MHVSTRQSDTSHNSDWPTDRLAVGNTSQEFLSYPATPLRFKTFPDPRIHSGSHFRFIASSCALPNFPYVPGGGDTLKGFDLLAEYLWPKHTSKRGGQTVSENVATPGVTTDGQGASISSTPTASLAGEQASHIDPPASKERAASGGLTTEFLMFLGDFIYADVPRYFGDNQDAYRRLYRRNYASQSFRKIYERLRTCLPLPVAPTLLIEFSQLSSTSMMIMRSVITGLTARAITSIHLRCCRS